MQKAVPEVAWHVPYARSLVRVAERLLQKLMPLQETEAPAHSALPDTLGVPVTEMSTQWSLGHRNVHVSSDVPLTAVQEVESSAVAGTTAAIVATRLMVMRMLARIGSPGQP